jgi:2-polyprenyl-3-methyl-5-hydroxy-6-metoxy-1,4-benzoquinol methylase
MTTTEIRSSQATTEEFAERVLEAAIHTTDVLAMYLGEKLGLYRAISQHGPVSRDELSRHAPIHWRYAQEWLEQQASAGILTVEAGEGADRRYALPVGHAEVLLDRDSLSYLAPLVRVMVAGARALPELLEAYRVGGGVSWAQLGDDARTGQADMNRPWFLQAIPTEWFPAIPGLEDRLTAGARVADVGCGEGWSSIGIALAYPGVEVDGYDFDGPSVEAARKHAAEAGVSERVRFHQVDAATLEDEDVFDAVVGFEFIHDLPDPVGVLASMRRMAKPGAPVVVMDENVPDRLGEDPTGVEHLMYGFSLFVCLPDGMSHQPSAATGTVLRAPVMAAYAREAGFADAEVLPIENDLWRFYRLVEA